MDTNVPVLMELMVFTARKIWMIVLKVPAIMVVAVSTRLVATSADVDQDTLAHDVKGMLMNA